MTARRYWIGVVSQDHVDRAVEGSYVQVNHGRAGPLERMHPGDGFVFYSPRASHPDGPVLQQFTAIGTVRDAPLQRADGADGEPVFRRPMDFLPASPASARALIGDLSFIRSKTHWGAAFRFGFLPVPEQDFARIAQAMGRRFRIDFPAEPGDGAAADSSREPAGVSCG